MATADAPRTLQVSVVYALPQQQTLLAVEAAEPLSAAEAVRRSGIAAIHPEIDLARLRLGVFGEAVDAGHRLRDGDRVEIYRPLQMDPREARRQLAGQGQVMGRGVGVRPDGD